MHLPITVVIYIFVCGINNWDKRVDCCQHFYLEQLIFIYVMIRFLGQWKLSAMCIYD